MLLRTTKQVKCFIQIKIQFYLKFVQIAWRQKKLVIYSHLRVVSKETIFRKNFNIHFKLIKIIQRFSKLKTLHTYIELFQY